MLENVKVGQKLLGGYVVVALVAMAVGMVGFFGLLSASTHIVNLTRNLMTGNTALLTLQEAQNGILLGERGLTSRRMMDPPNRQAQYAWIDRHWKEADQALGTCDALPRSGEEAALYRELLSAWNGWKADHQAVRSAEERVDQLLAAGADLKGARVAALEEEAFSASMTAHRSFQDAQDKLSRLIDLNKSEARAEEAAGAAAMRREETTLVILSLLTSLAAIAIGLVLSRGITRPLARGVEMMREMGRGHLGTRLRLNRGDEIGELGATMDQCASDLQNLMVGPMTMMAAGNLGFTIVAKDDKDEIAPALLRTQSALRELVNETGRLSQAAVEGKLSVRADASRHQGEFRNMVQGINDTLDAVIHPMEEAAEVLERVADRDLTARVQGEYKGDHARIKDSLNQAVENLDQGLQQVGLAVEQVAAASNQIGTGSQALAQGASEQASSLEEVSSSLQEITSITRRNAASAKEASGLAEGTRGSVNQGLESMNRLSEAMERIKTSSDSTAKIVKTIDEIAFQTNLLALNAAVEAARAGDAGKGFAVVAEEVRNLAMRSAEAAKNTANMIEESVRNAESGVSLNEEVLNKLQEINEQANRVGEVMNDVVTASESQTSGVEQVTTAVEQMNQVTQQNAANSEESASAAEELSGQAGELRSMVERFRLSQDAVLRPAGAPAHHAGAARRPAPPPATVKPRPPLRLVPGRSRTVPSYGASDPESVIPLGNERDQSALNEF